jgi:hypothetical protein
MPKRSLATALLTGSNAKCNARSPKMPGVYYADSLSLPIKLALSIFTGL